MTSGKARKAEALSRVLACASSPHVGSSVASGDQSIMKVPRQTSLARVRRLLYCLLLGLLPVNSFIRHHYVFNKSVSQFDPLTVPSLRFFPIRVEFALRTEEDKRSGSQNFEEPLFWTYILVSFALEEDSEAAFRTKDHMSSLQNDNRCSCRNVNLLMLSSNSQSATHLWPVVMPTQWHRDHESSSQMLCMAWVSNQTAVFKGR
jgi:uncharacterized protein YbdZ (MbtH family)